MDDRPTAALAPTGHTGPAVTHRPWGEPVRLRAGFVALLLAVLLPPQALPSAAAVAATSAARPASASAPNIVVVYMDDVAPTDGQLWASATRTPTINDLFVQHGATFSHAIGETPLCCPARG